MEPQTIQSSVAFQLVPLTNPSLIFLLVSIYGKLGFSLYLETIKETSEQSVLVHWIASAK